MSDATAVVRQAYECFDRGDIPGSGAVAWAGERRGIAQVTKFFEAIGTLARLEEFRAEEFLSSGHRVIVFGHDWWHTCTVKAGKISVFREYTDTADVNSAF